MFDYTTIMIARKEHEELGRKGTPEYTLRPAQDALLRRTLDSVGGVLISIGGRLRSQGEPKVNRAPVP
jgi:hypothetical protein